MTIDSAKPAAGRRKVPENITYGVDDVPPPLVVILSALQHVAVIGALGIIFPLLVLRQIEISADESARVISASMLALGIGTLIQCRRGRFIGSGYLAPVVFTAAYLPANIIAVKVGGLPLVAGMTVLAGLTEIAIGAAILRLRPYVPTEIAGFAVMMIGVVLGMLGFRLIFLEPHAAPEVAPAAASLLGPFVHVFLGTLALTAMVAASVWGGRTLRLYSILVGILLGYGAALLLGAVDAHDVLHGIMSPPHVPHLPSAWPTLALDLVVPYAVGALASALRALGDIATCQKINDASWTRPNMRSIRAGLMADGVGTAIAGAIGSVGLNTFSGSVALSAATGVTSRVVGYATAAIFGAMAFLPGIGHDVALLPQPVMGATLLFSGSFIIFNGIQIIVTRLLDSRKVLVLGIALILGLSVYAFPQVYDALPRHVQPLTSSPFVLAIASAVILNAVFRIGIRRRTSLTYDPRRDSTDILVDFLAKQGALWAARRDVIQRVTSALVELSDHLREFAPQDSKATLSLSFDESSVDVEVAYDGARSCCLSRHPMTPAPFPASTIFRRTFADSSFPGLPIEQGRRRATSCRC